MAGVAAFGGTGFAIRPPRHQRLEEGQHGRSSFSSPSTSGPGGRIRPGHSDGSGARSRRAAVALLLLSGRARRGIGLTTHGFEKQRHRTTSSSFCSTRCRDCVLALAELHPSPLATDDFIARRALLTDRLLDLWRHGQGPDPALVLEAARTASSGLASADTA